MASEITPKKKTLKKIQQRKNPLPQASFRRIFLFYIYVRYVLFSFQWFLFTLPLQIDSINSCTYICVCVHISKLSASPSSKIACHFFNAPLIQAIMIINIFKHKLKRIQRENIKSYLIDSNGQMTTIFVHDDQQKFT